MTNAAADSTKAYKKLIAAQTERTVAFKNLMSTMTALKSEMSKDSKDRKTSFDELQIDMAKNNNEF